jgi:hypothetical protein
MELPKHTRVLVRVQARGGKFLGPNVNYAQITVLDGERVVSGPVLASGNSGTVDPKSGDPIAAGASRDVIVVQPTTGGPPAGAYWLLPSPSGAAGAIVGITLMKPALLEFRATALYDTPNPVTASAMMWVVPGSDLVREPGLLLSIPGLYVSVAQPAVDVNQVTVTATVKMMCGCPITWPTWPQASGGPEPYWPYPEFDVLATLTDPSGNPSTRRMAFQAENTFSTSFPLPSGGKSTIGVYAVQQAETNVGYAQTTFKV